MQGIAPPPPRPNNRQRDLDAGQNPRVDLTSLICTVPSISLTTAPISRADYRLVVSRDIADGARNVLQLLSSAERPWVTLQHAYRMFGRLTEVVHIPAYRGCTADDLCNLAFLLGSDTVIHVSPGFYRSISAHARSESFSAHSPGPWPEAIPLATHPVPPPPAGDCVMCMTEVAEVGCRNGHGHCWACVRRFILQTYHATSPRCHCGDHFTMQLIVAAIGRCPADYDVRPPPAVVEGAIPDDDPQPEDNQGPPPPAPAGALAPMQPAAPAAPPAFIPPPPPPMPQPPPPPPPVAPGMDIRSPAFPYGCTVCHQFGCPAPAVREQFHGPSLARAVPCLSLPDGVRMVVTGEVRRDGRLEYDPQHRLRNNPREPQEGARWNPFQSLITYVRRRMGSSPMDPGRPDRFVPRHAPANGLDGGPPVDRSPVNAPSGRIARERVVETEDDLVYECRREMELATCFSEAGPSRASKLRNAGAQYLKRRECARLVSALRLSPNNILTRATQEPVDINLVGHCRAEYSEREISSMDLHNSYIRQHKVLVCGIPTSWSALSLYGSTFVLQHGPDRNLRWVSLAMCFALRKQAPQMAACAYGASMGIAALPATTVLCAGVARSLPHVSRWAYEHDLVGLTRVVFWMYTSVARLFYRRVAESVSDLVVEDLRISRYEAVIAACKQAFMRPQSQILRVTTQAYAVGLPTNRMTLALYNAQVPAETAGEVMLSERRVAFVSFGLAAIVGALFGYMGYRFIVRPTHKLRE